MLRHGGRYSPAGVSVVNFASVAVPDELVLGWTEVDATPERIPDEDGEPAIRAFVVRWLEERRSLLAGPLRLELAMNQIAGER